MRRELRRPGAPALSWLLGLLVAVVSWDVGFSPPSYGLDSSWWSAMYMAANRGLHFGTQIVFTYGPLAFLREAWLWYDDLATLGFLYSAMLHILLSVSLVWALRRTLGTALAATLAAVALLAAPEREVALSLAAIWCLVALSPEAPAFSGWLLTVGGALLGAIEMLVELQSGPVIWGIALLALAAKPKWRVLVPAYIATASGAFVLLWIVAGQSFANLPAYLSRGAQIVSGYSQAMGLQSASTASRFAPLGMILIGAVLIVAAARSAAPRRERLGAALVMALTVFALYKEGVVRAEPHHETIFFSTAAIVAGGFAYRGRRMIAAAAVLALSALAFVALPGDVQVDLNPLSHAQNAFDQARLLVSPGRRARIRFFYAISMALHYRLDRATLALLKGQSVQVDPWEAAVAWLYRLDWDPVPIFQGYSAYTAELDHLNERKLSSAGAPTRILRENTALIEHTAPAIDGRVPAWDPPAATLATLCRYVALRTTATWQVLGRVPDRCGSARRIATINTAYGQTVRIRAPSARGLLFAKVYGVAVSGIFDRVQTLLYRAKFRYVYVNGASRFRVVPGTAADGLLLDAPAGADYPAPFALSPDVRTIEFTGPSGPLRIELEWMPLTAR